MMKAPVSVCLIVKNEQIQIENCLKSIRDYVEEIIVVDTGSTDDTPEIAKKYADKFEIFTDCNDEQGRIDSFSMARQRSFELATHKWVMWIDGDDQLENAQNLKTFIEEHDGIEQDVMAMFPYEYSHDALGNPTCVHYRERLVNNNAKNFFWYGPVHEVLVPRTPQNTLVKKIDTVKFVHRRSQAKIVESGRNLRILKKFYEKIGDSDARQLYYLGLEYSNNNNLENSNKFLQKYVDLSGWDDEKCLAYLKMAENHFIKGDLQESIYAALKASQVKETWGEPHFWLSKCYYFLAQKGGPEAQRNWERCSNSARVGLNLPPTETMLFINPLDRNVEIHRYANVALANLGDVRSALASVNMALKHMPNDEQLNFNKNFYENHLIRSNINDTLNVMLNNKSITKDQYDSVLKIFDGKQDVNFISNSNPDIHKIINKLRNEKKYVENCYVSNEDGKPFVFSETKEVSYKENALDIVFYVGPGWEEWTPNTVKKTGIGGSELMAINMAKELATLGHRVKVFSGCGETGEGIYDGVEYLLSEKFKDLKCDVLIVSRVANMLDDGYNIDAKVKILWCHDVVAVNATNKLLLNADRVFALSNWHKDHLMKAHNLQSKQVVVTRNGIDINRFNKNVDRNTKRAINSSSPDRSWPVLLDVWPEIRKQVPTAELHLLYGFQTWKKMAPNRPGESETIEKLEKQIESLKNDGVVFHDRVSQEELAEEFLKSGAWIYCTWFSETSCISAMEAQAAGLRIVTSSIAALNETVADRGVRIGGDWTSFSYKSEFVKRVVEALNDEKSYDRDALQKYAEEHFSLTALAQEWQDIFSSLIEEKKVNPILPYQPTENYK